MSTLDSASILAAYRHDLVAACTKVSDKKSADAIDIEYLRWSLEQISYWEKQVYIQNNTRTTDLSLQ